MHYTDTDDLFCVPLQTHKLPILKPDATFEQKFDQIKEQLLQMNPAQRNINLDALGRLLEGSGHIVDIKLPKKAPQGCGRPKGATTSPKPQPTHPRLQLVQLPNQNQRPAKQTTQNPQLETLQLLNMWRKKVRGNCFLQLG
jgi:hypothetical protein